MLNIITVFKSGGEFSRDYVINLRRGVLQNLTIPHRFICLTNDMPSNTVDGVRHDDASFYDEDSLIEWKALEHDWPRHWSKVEMFRPDIEKYGRFLFIDLSSVIVGSLDDMAAVEHECVTRDFYHGVPSQSILMFSPGSMREVWEKFNEDPNRWISEGSKMVAPYFHDQILMADMDIPFWQDVLPGQVVSFKKHCEQGVPVGARIIKFHGNPKPHEIVSGWLKGVWDGTYNRVDYPTSSNTSDDKCLEYYKINNARDLPWVEQVKKRIPEPLAIVGGGPSVKESIGFIRAHQLRGGHVWSLNGTHDYLIENNIIPNALVMLDSREHNTGFVQRPHKDVTYYIAARCHPKVFEALKGFKVVVWHPRVNLECEEYYMGDRGILIGGGSTIGLRAMYLAWMGLGYLSFHLYGFDSSYRDDEGHAYSQDVNVGEIVTEVVVNGRAFHTARWMASQAEGFRDQCLQMAPRGVEINVHGEGLIPYIASLMADE